MKAWLSAFAVTVLGGLTVIGTGAPASAHPLGNFSINHYHGLRLYADRIEDLAILDEAEIPTHQTMSRVDTNGDRSLSDGERSSFAVAGCRDIVSGLKASADGHRLLWTVIASTFTLHPIAANLPTSRTECRLAARANLRHGATVDLTDTYRTDRVGWREITAVADGIRLDHPSVSATSRSDELRRYPDDLLAAPLNQRTVSLRTTEHAAVATLATAPTLGVPGPIGRGLDALTRRLYTLAGAGHLGVTVGLLGVGLALLLGAAHAALPGHGKTVMAAYVAGRRGTVRDALTVGMTVTATHTTGVLVLGLLLTLLTGLAGEVVLGWLGVGSGLLIAGIGVGLLGTARRRLAARQVERSIAATALPVREPVAALTASTLTTMDPVPTARPDDTHARVRRPSIRQTGSHRHHHHDREVRLGRAGLVGMGVAGGLVPSPSALVVLLGAIALGHTWFGVLLMVGYGVGMAATLTVAGLALVGLRSTLDSAAVRRLGRLSSRPLAVTPMLTAVLVLLVGLGLAVRALVPLLGTL